MDDMRVDHVSYTAEHDGLQATAARLAKVIGVDPVDGGVHPRFGTRNIIFPLADERYVEVVDCLDHPASDKAPFGQAVKARMEAGGGWLGWCVRVDDIAPVEERLGRPAVEGNRHRPDGVELRWRQLGIKGLLIAGDPERVKEWLGLPADQTASSVIDFTFVAPRGTPGLLAVTFQTPEGLVTV